MSLNVGHPIAEQASENSPPSLSNFNSMVRIVNALRRMIFDPTYFNVTNNGDAPPVISLRYLNEDDWEWVDTGVDGNIVTVLGAQCKYGGSLIPAVDPTELACDFTDPTSIPVGEECYLFVEIVAPDGTVELKVQTTRPVDDPASSTIRVALSKWMMTSSGPVRTMLLHRGAIQISSVYNP